MVTIRQVTSADQTTVTGLCELLLDAVNGGASVGFLAPLSQQTAREYWDNVFRSLGGNLYLWAAQVDGRLIGSVQLEASSKQNARHRAEIPKLLVHSANRGQGISTQLMSVAEGFARSIDRTLLVLDTQAGSVAEPVYKHLGWQKVGEIPYYAASQTGSFMQRRTTTSWPRPSPFIERMSNGRRPSAAAQGTRWAAQDKNETFETHASATTRHRFCVHYGWCKSGMADNFPQRGAR